MYNFKILNCLFKILFLRISIKYSFQINCYLKKKKTFFSVSLQEKKNIYFHLSKNLFFLFSNQSISVHQKMLNHSSRYPASCHLFQALSTSVHGALFSLLLPVRHSPLLYYSFVHFSLAPPHSSCLRLLADRTLPLSFYFPPPSP